MTGEHAPMVQALPPTPSAGFSLVEMLVALVVIGLGALVFTAGIGRIGTALALSQQVDAEVDGIARAQFLLRERLAGAEPLSDPQLGAGSVDFIGQDDHVDFVGEPAERDAPDAMQRYRIARDPDGQLVLYVLSTLDDRVDFRSRAQSGWTRHPLLAGTAGLRLRYLGGAGAGGPVWQDEWSRRETLPLAVAIDVTLPDDDPRSWPPLVVRLRAGAAGGCGTAAGPGCSRTRSTRG